MQAVAPKRATCLDSPSLGQSFRRWLCRASGSHQPARSTTRPLAAWRPYHEGVQWRSFVRLGPDGLCGQTAQQRAGTLPGAGKPRPGPSCSPHAARLCCFGQEIDDEYQRMRSVPPPPPNREAGACGRGLTELVCVSAATCGTPLRFPFAQQALHSTSTKRTGLRS